MNDIKRALLGDHEAAKRLTDAGELLPCPCCGGKPTTRIRVKAECIEMEVKCFNCGTNKFYQVEICDTEFNKLTSGMTQAIKAWNTRAPILSAEEMEMLHGKENP